MMNLSLRSELGRWSGWIADDWDGISVKVCVLVCRSDVKENGKEAKETNDWENWNGADVFKNYCAKLTGVLQWMNGCLWSVLHCGAFSDILPNDDDDTTWSFLFVDTQWFYCRAASCSQKEQWGQDPSLSLMKLIFDFLQDSLLTLMHFLYECFRNFWRKLIQFSYLARV